MEYWTYSTEFKSVEEVGILFTTKEEAEKHSLKSYLDQGLTIIDWEQLTSYYKFKLV